MTSHPVQKVSFSIGKETLKPMVMITVNVEFDIGMMFTSV